jgi:hypothetical protein
VVILPESDRGRVPCEEQLTSAWIVCQCCFVANKMIFLHVHKGSSLFRLYDCTHKVSTHCVVVNY